MLDTLGDFHAESDLPQGGLVMASRDPQSKTVASILSASVPLEWYEAVAVAQSVSAKLQDSGDASGPVRVGAEHVALDPSGEVHVAAVRRSSGSSALDQVAELLRLMLWSATVPAPLRLAIATSSSAGSLEEWSKNLNYYERPDRQSLVRAVYERAVAAQAVPPGPAPDATSVAPLVAPPVAEQPLSEDRTRGSGAFPRWVPIIAAALVVAALSAGFVWFLRAQRAGSPRSGDPPTVEPTLVTASSAIGRLIAQIPVFRGAESLEFDPPPPPTTGRWIHLPSGRLTVVESSPMMSLPVARSVPVTPEVLDSVAGTVIPPRAPAPGSPIVTYSAADASVIPPVAIYPQFPTRFPPGTTPDDFAEFDVIVTAAGDVESVRARRIPETMAEAVRVTMSLSAAKTWRFRPGMKDGEPVRYRQVIRVLNN